jgi:hypothetical protein
VARRAFELTDQVTDEDGRHDGDREVHVRLGAADFVDERAGRVDEPLLQVPVHELLDWRR